MKHMTGRIGWSVAVIAILLSPLALISWVPLAMCIGIDLGNLDTLRLAALALWAPVGLVLLLNVLRRGQLAMLDDDAGELPYAP
jgi:hypothetical protein